jgi:DNA invertase Pin-like site-specific DNA recombinase
MVVRATFFRGGKMSDSYKDKIDINGLRFASYSRASTSKQEDSRERQERDIREWAERSGAHVHEWYFDCASGKKIFDDRPEARLLMDAIRDDRIDAVVIESLSRLGRNPLDVLLTVGRLTGLGMGGLGKTMEMFSVYLYDLSLGRFLDMENSDDRMHVWMRCMVADVEHARISARVKSNFRLRRSRGGDTAIPTYGFKWHRFNDGVRAAIHVPKEECVDIIAEVLPMICDGYSSKEIRKHILQKFPDSEVDLPTVNMINTIKRKLEKYCEAFGYVH